jgi:hypothetical protein
VLGGEHGGRGGAGSYFLMFCLFLFLFNNLNVLVIGAFTSELYVPRLEILVAEVLSFGGAVMMYPFFICTFRITSAEQIICKLGAMALSATDPARNSTLALVAANKPKVSVFVPCSPHTVCARRCAGFLYSPRRAPRSVDTLWIRLASRGTQRPSHAVANVASQICHAVESLANIGLNMQQGDKIHSYQIGHELCELVLSYGALHKHMLPDSWHIIDVSACESPDFFNLDYESLQTLETNQAWLEWKVLRQYQMLFANALTRKSPGFASLIAANTRKICEAAAVQVRGCGHVGEFILPAHTTLSSMFWPPPPPRLTDPSNHLAGTRRHRRPGDEVLQHVYALRHHRERRRPMLRRAAAVPQGGRVPASSQHDGAQPRAGQGWRSATDGAALPGLLQRAGAQARPRAHRRAHRA